VLLSKSRLTRERDDVDFEQALPLLDEASRARLRVWLPADHRWHTQL
jgi:hypothetical protein